MNLDKKSLAAIALAVAATASAAQPVVRVDGAWARPTVAGQAVGGAYLTIRSPAADRLVAATTPAASAVEMHTMSMDGSTMQMRRVDAIDIGAGQPVELKPGGLHLMLVGLSKPLQAGQSVPLTLRFEKAGAVDVQLDVSLRGPGGGTRPAHDHAGHAGHAGHKH